MTQGALAGCRVVDLSRVLAGPMCSMWLGDMGADVVKIERPGCGDDTRAWGPPFAGSEAAYYLGVNRNKRSLTLDLSRPEGREVLAELIRGADVVLDNFKIGTLEGWGFDDDWYEAEAATAVRATVSGYGSTGPKAAMPGYDFILQAETGLMSVTGEPGGESMKHGVALVDVCTGMLAAISVLGALAARVRTGKGQRIEVSLHDTGIAMLANVAANHLVSGAEAARYGNGHPNIVPYRTYPTADSELVVTVGNDAQFAKFARVMGAEHWADDERFALNADRVANRDLLDGLIRERMAARPCAQWMADLQAEGIPCSPINSVAEALASPQTLARQMVTTVDHPEVGGLALTGVPFKMSATPGAVRRPPPTLGQHSREVLTELGFDEAKLAELADAGVTTL
ncbi:MAG: CoA transferase [Acidimicrobiaceae bacterium]|nr:CoA transferase [Acidimicrobiaceae bacterium]MCY4294414.1 CoA transferase [Acidimicrobiaceae bacterium]